MKSEDSPLTAEPSTSAQSDLATPEEHAKATGNLAPKPQTETAKTFGRKDKPQIVRLSWQHEAAAQLHGWRAHSSHSAEPLLITRAAYLAALKASAEPFCAKTCPKTGVVKDGPSARARHGHYEPHVPAMSPYAPRVPAPEAE